MSKEFKMGDLVFMVATLVSLGETSNQDSGGGTGPSSARATYTQQG